MLDIVITTISDGSFLKTWEKLIRQAGRMDDVRLVVIPDVSTPRSLYRQVKELQSRGITVLCPSTARQAAFLGQLGCRWDFIPLRSDNRRNIGYLMSWVDGADAVISVDDDNFPIAETWFRTHEVVTSAPASHLGVSSSSGWFNGMALLSTRPSGPFWPRGFPYWARDTEMVVTETWDEADIAINAGVWLGDPDVDAITRLAAHPVAWAQERTSVVLAPDTWMPVNSQNTAIRRDVIPAYYFARMPAWGGRMGDIFQGYFAQACAKHLGHSVRVGTPLVNQDRNQHHLLHDLELEHPFLRLLEQLLVWLPDQKLEGDTYRATYESLSFALDDVAGEFPKQEKDYLRQLAHDMHYWLGLCDQIGRT